MRLWLKYSNPIKKLKSRSKTFIEFITRTKKETGCMYYIRVKITFPNVICSNNEWPAALRKFCGLLFADLLLHVPNFGRNHLTDVTNYYNYIIFAYLYLIVICSAYTYRLFFSFKNSLWFIGCRLKFVIIKKNNNNYIKKVYFFTD